MRADHGGADHGERTRGADAIACGMPALPGRHVAIEQRRKAFRQRCPRLVPGLVGAAAHGDREHRLLVPASGNFADQRHVAVFRARVVPLQLAVRHQVLPAVRLRRRSPPSARQSRSTTSGTARDRRARQTAPASRGSRRARRYCRRRNCRGAAPAARRADSRPALPLQRREFHAHQHHRSLHIGDDLTSAGRKRPCRHSLRVA